MDLTIFELISNIHWLLVVTGILLVILGVISPFPSKWSEISLSYLQRTTLFVLGAAFVSLPWLDIALNEGKNGNIS